MIDIADFQKLDIRIGEVISVEKIEGADRLLKFIFDFGGEKRQIIAGIAHLYPDPKVLLGKQMPILVNLRTKEIKGNKSQGMILAINADGRIVFLQPEEKVPSGSIVC